MRLVVVMDRAIGVRLISFCRNEPLFESLVATLRTSFADNVQCLTSAELKPEFDPVLTSAPNADFLVFLLITDQAARDSVAEFIQVTRTRTPDAGMIVVSEDCDVEQMLDLVKRGASDFMGPQVNISSTVPRILRLVASAERGKDPTQALKAKVGMKLLVGQSASFVSETRKIPLLASCDGRVLILGETGTGKESIRARDSLSQPANATPVCPRQLRSHPARTPGKRDVWPQ